MPEWRPPLPPSVRRLLEGAEVDGGGNGPTVDRGWGESELTPAERGFAWNSLGQPYATEDFGSVVG